MGLFGGITKGLGKLNTANDATGLSFMDRLGAAGRALGGDPDAGVSLQKIAAARMAQQQQAQAQALRARLMAPQQQPLNPDNPSALEMVEATIQGRADAPTVAQVTARPPPMLSRLKDPATQAQLAELHGLDPQQAEFTRQMLKDREPDAPRYVEGPDGIYSISSGKASKIQDYPERPNTTPGQVNPQTGRWEWAPGYLESQASLAGVRRDAVVSRPTPSRARPSSGGHRAVPSSAPTSARTYDPDVIKWGN